MDGATVYGLGFFVVVAICWWDFVRETRNPEHGLHRMIKLQQRVFWIVGFLMSVAVAALWPISLPCYLCYLVWFVVTRKRPEGPL